VLDSRRPARHAGGVHGDVDVVTTDPVDRAVHVGDDGLQGKRDATSAEVAQQERQSQSGRQVVGQGGRLERAVDLMRVQDEGLESGQGHDELAGCRLESIAGEPVTAQRPQSKPMVRTVAGAQRQCSASRVTVAQHGSEPGAKLETPESQALFLLLQVTFLGVQFMLELPGEVIEEVVPSHAVTLATAADAEPPVFHSSRRALDNGKFILVE